MHTTGSRERAVVVALQMHHGPRDRLQWGVSARTLGEVGTKPAIAMSASAEACPCLGGINALELGHSADKLPRDFLNALGTDEQARNRDVGIAMSTGTTWPWKGLPSHS